MSGDWDDSPRFVQEMFRRWLSGVIRMLESSFTDPMTSLWKRMRSVLIRWFSRVSRFRSLSEYGGWFSKRYLKHRIKT